MQNETGKTQQQLIEEIKSLQRQLAESEIYRAECERLERNLKLSEQKFDKLLRSIPDIFYITDEYGRITFISDAVRQYGHNPIELIGKNVLDLVLPEDRESARFRLNERRTGSRSTRLFEIRLFTRNKSSVPFEIKIMEVPDMPVFQVSTEGYYESGEHDGQYLGTLGVARDISRRKLVEGRLKTFREELQRKVGDFHAMVRQLNKIGIALSSEHNIVILLEMIVKEARIFTRSDGGSLYLKRNGQLRFEVTQNDTLTRRLGEAPFTPFNLPIDGSSVAGYVAMTGEIVNIADLEHIGGNMPFSLDAYRDFDSEHGYRSVSMLAVPMRNHKDEIIGVLQLINALDTRGEPTPYNKDLEELVFSLASQAAVAISNSRFIQDIHNLFEGVVTYSAQAIDSRSPHTAGHSERVAFLSLAMANAINSKQEGPFANVFFTEEQLTELKVAAWLHDIGKLGVRESVLDKVNKLSGERIETIVNRFSYIGYVFRSEAAERKLGLITAGYDPASVEVADLDRETDNKLKELKSDLDLIFRLNIPHHATPEDLQRLHVLESRTYHDIHGSVHPYLSHDEVEHLRVERGNLTDDERREIEDHVHHTVKILEKIPFTEELKNIPKIAAAHHEMLNGTGYPLKLTSADIPIQSRIIAVGDVYEALTAADRPYKKAVSHEDSLRILRDEADKGRLDPDLVELFISDKLYLQKT